MNKQFLGSGKSNLSDWKDHPVVPKAIFKWVTTDLPEYVETPEYVISLSGNASIWPVLGASSVYSPSNRRFLVILAFDVRYAGITLTGKVAQAWNWTINWAAFGDPTIEESQQNDGSEVWDEAAQIRALPDELDYKIPRG